MKAHLFILAVFAVTLTASASLLGSSNNLGVTVIPTDKLKDAPDQSGLLIATVVPGSPAANLGLTRNQISTLRARDTSRLSAGGLASGAATYWKYRCYASSELEISVVQLSLSS